jgi:glycosyltransferase involved in cell wall biosynthesis
LSRVFRGAILSPNSCSSDFNKNDYAKWLSLYDNQNELTNIQCLVQEMADMPLISVIMPTYKSNTQWLKEAIDSVIGQIYPNWELCIADDASNDPVLYSLLNDYAKTDSRIKFVIRKVNGHISAASNSALELATGNWIALLDHDDLLHPSAFFWVADCINRSPHVRLIYSDEDKISESGIRMAPYFKTNWNRDLFYSHNMICHLGVYSKKLVEEIGGFREGFEGAQDYDLALRCIERLNVDREIQHIPKVLYHWRVHQQSTAKDANAKPYAMIAGERALNEHFQRSSFSGRIELTGHGYRAFYDLPKPAPLVSLIIPTRNGLHFLRKCIESIISKTDYPNYEIVIVDNGSDDPDTLHYLSELKEIVNIQIIRDDSPFNYSALNNLGVSAAKGKVIGLINNDIEVISSNWLSEMVGHVMRSDVGAVGAKLLFGNGTLQHAGVILGIGGWAGHLHKGFPRYSDGYAGRASLTSEFSAVTGACLLIRAEIYNQLGGLNDVDLKVACNDVDLCLRIRALGLRIVWTPYAELFHHESATRGYEDDPVKKARFAQEVSYMRDKWGEIFENDPMYSPNLTLDHEDASFAWPPRA